MSAAPPLEVPLAFLAALNKTVEDFEELLVPVARGSVLMRHWFGDRARPAADLDLECFQRDRDEPLPPEEEEWVGDGFGRHGEFESLVDFGKAMCRYAANGTRYQWSGSGWEESDALVFQPPKAPVPGTSLWIYGTPGERYFADWLWRANGDQTGRLQIDIAAAGYALHEIAVEPLEVTAGGKVTKCPAYTPEALLAAKVSWLVRGFVTPAGGAIAWKGEPKDLFDAHLLLTAATLRPGAFQKSLLAIGAQDRLDWGAFATLFRAAYSLEDADFANWSDFDARNPDLAPAGPAELLRAVADRLEPLLGDCYRRDEMPFLLAVRQNERDELARLVYADFLDDHGDAARSAVVRRLAALEFRGGEMPADQFRAARAAALDALDAAPTGWLFQLLGTAQKLQELREDLAADAG